MKTYKSIRGLGLALMILIPAAFLSITYNQTLTKDLILGIAATAVCVAYLIGNSQFHYSKFSPAIHVSLGIYILINIVSISLNLTTIDAMGYVVRELILILFFYLYINIAKNSYEYTVTRWLSFANLIVLAVGLIQIVFHADKPYSTFGNPNFFGGYLVAVWPLMLVGLKDQNKMFRTLNLFNLILFLLNAIFIRSWAMYLSLAASFYFLVPLWMKSPKKRLIGWISITLLVLSFWNIRGVQNSLIAQISGDIRPYIWEGTVRLIQQYPILGCGAGQYGSFYPIFRTPEYFKHPLSVDNTDHAHCEFLEMLSEVGIFGTLAFIVFLILIFGFVVKNAAKSDKNIQWISYGAILGVGLLLLENMFDVNLRYTSSRYMLWLLLGWSLGLSLKNKTLEIKTFQIKSFYKGLVMFLSIIVFCMFFLRPYIADIYFNKGVQARNNQDYRNAINYYEKALRMDSDKAEAYYRLAYLYGLLGQNEMAVRCYLSVMDISPYYSSVHGNLGTIYLRMGKLKEAYHHLMIQISLNPYDPDRLCTLAAALLQMGREEEAKKYLRKALIYNPKHAFALKVLKKGV